MSVADCQTLHVQIHDLILPAPSGKAPLLASVKGELRTDLSLPCWVRLGVIVYMGRCWISFVALEGMHRQR